MIRNITRSLLALAFCLVGLAVAPSSAYADSNPGQITTCGSHAIWFISANHPLGTPVITPIESGTAALDSYCMHDEPGQLRPNNEYNNGYWQNSWNWVALINPTPYPLYIKGIDIKTASAFEDCINGSQIYYLHERDAQPFYWIYIKQGIFVEKCKHETPHVVPMCTVLSPETGAPIVTDGPFEAAAFYARGGSGAFDTGKGNYWPHLYCWHSQGQHKITSVVNWQFNAWGNRVWLHQDPNDAYAAKNCYDSGYLYHSLLDWSLTPNSADLTYNPASCNN